MVLEGINHDAWLKWPERCDVSVTRKGEEEPCGAWAIGVGYYLNDGYGEWESHAYPVCKHHARGRPMLNLKDVIALVHSRALGGRP